MSNNINRVIIAGNLTRDPEIRYSSEGRAMGRLRLAVNRRWTSKQGDSKEETSYFNVSAYGRQAEVLARYLVKGSPHLVDGRLRSYSYENEKGESRHNVEVVMEGFNFLPGPRREDCAAAKA